MNLSELKIGNFAKILDIHLEQEKLIMLYNMGIVPNIYIYAMCFNKLSGIFCVNSRLIALDKKIIKQIEICYG